MTAKKTDAPVYTIKDVTLTFDMKTPDHVSDAVIKLAEAAARNADAIKAAAEIFQKINSGNTTGIKIGGDQ